ncbi:BREX-2 system adenine-specific DNA-methyltransferase PglX [Cellulomonas sp. zg-ZUI22]|uniref:BREX-2 system adenine-specific DNA-methyltransferase PglX n=1 Tax=Cellulomonas sp. zg-ZUI22 TaxID=2816955 RepID=UPI001A93E55B|nr:BREX-2 system adenine-specific DNA-methyltransferase PglX [Cellulomonas sp. zg-ZUI22]MBO0898929.1 BREX-2 system adenine-specific DNA-methyltransferase PglX [Cellulomonas sp. zg-ZUI22]
MIHSSALLADLKAQLKLLQADLKARADDPTTEWGAALQREHAEALRRERTGLSWTAWRDNEVDQAAVAWVIATTFIRFCEDNDLLAGATLDGMPVPVGWIAGPGDRTARARENQTAYFRVHTSHHDRDWLQQAFRVLAAQPAGAALVDPKHNPVWTAEISAEAAKGLVNFWRRTHDDGTLIHDLTDPELDTRFLGDLYQDLSEHAKKTYALLQTPEFVEEFILDRTLTPAIAEFGIDGLKLIDPTCGSGHFLLGAFHRLNAQWAAEAPGLDPRQRVLKAMDSIHGVDINPFAVAIARFRLTVAAIQMAGEKSLVGVPRLGFHLAIGDSLLGEQGGGVGLFDESETFVYGTEDLGKFTGILRPGQYHVVVGNPPYITVKDPALNQKYRQVYSSAYKKYALTVPFAELFFRLATLGTSGRGAGYVGQITSNSFMKREFGKKLIEEFFAGYHLDNPVDLTHVIDSQGAWMPGHNFDGTPTCVIFGRRRRPVNSTVRTVFSVKDDPGKRSDPENGPVWSEIVKHLDDPGFDGEYVSVGDLARKELAKFPWVLNGGGASALMSLLISASPRALSSVISEAGFSDITGNDEIFLMSRATAIARGMVTQCYPFVEGGAVRDWTVTPQAVSLMFSSMAGEQTEPNVAASRHLWPFRRNLRTAVYFGKTAEQRGMRWYDHAIFQPGKHSNRMLISYAFVSTHNHFVLDRGGRLFNKSAPVLKLPDGAGEREHLELLGVLNSSVACFWMRQVSQKKGGDADTPWLRTWEFTGTKLQNFPLPRVLPLSRATVLDDLARRLSATSPHAVIADWLRAGATDSLPERLGEARSHWAAIRARMMFEQEELDWDVYRLYGLIDEDLTYQGDWNGSEPAIGSGERAFALEMARREPENAQYTTWFDYVDNRTGQVHRFARVLEFPESWPLEYRKVVGRRLSAIQSSAALKILEAPDYKRRWAAVPWEAQSRQALKEAIVDRVADGRLWADHQGPRLRSIVQLVDELRRDEGLSQLASALTGSSEPDVLAVVEELVLSEAVPFLAAYRYTRSGLEKFHEWQEVWRQQRLEDAGGKVSFATPPRYRENDFIARSTWRLRGELDVSRELFTLFPGIAREGDLSPVLGWAAWTHRDQAVALVREVLTQQALGASEDALVPMVAGLVELEPWLHQWHTDLEPEFGSSAAQAVTSQIDQFLAELQMTRDDVNAWRPPAAARGRRRRT